MTVQELRNLFINNKANDLVPHTSLMTTISQYSEVEFSIEDDGITYCYSVDLATLAKSDIEQETLDEMIENGWQLSLDKKKIIKKL